MGCELRLYEGYGRGVPAWVAFGDTLYDRRACYPSVPAQALAPAPYLESARCRYGDGSARLLGLLHANGRLANSFAGYQRLSYCGVCGARAVHVVGRCKTQAHQGEHRSSVRCDRGHMARIGHERFRFFEHRLRRDHDAALCVLLCGAYRFGFDLLPVFYDVLMLTVIQFITEGLLGLATGAVFETLPALTQITPVIVGELAFVVLFATIFAFGVQNIALARIEPTQASLILSLESVFGVVFSILLYGELLTVRLAVGFVLIFIALLVSEGIFSRKRKTAS